MELTTSRAADLFLASLRTRSAPANTIKAYRLDLQQFLKQAPEDLSEVTADVIRVFLDSHEQHKPATRRRHAATLRAFYTWLMQQGVSISKREKCTLSRTGYATDFCRWPPRRMKV
jgi:site-specific recombinase XerD